MSFKICNLHTKKNNTIIHENLNWEIKQGSYWVLIGRSGCGKTTLSRIMTGLELPDSGYILWNNAECINLPKLWGVQFQHSALFNDRTALENIVFPLKYDQTKYTAQYLTDIALFYAYQMGLDHDLLFKYPHELSGGQKKLVALARALIKNPPMLMLDEPTAGLDPATAARYDSILNKIASKGNISIVVITHDIQRIKEAKNIAYMSGGKLSFPGVGDIKEELWHEVAAFQTHKK